MQDKKLHYFLPGSKPRADYSADIGTDYLGQKPAAFPLPDYNLHPLRPPDKTKNGLFKYMPALPDI